MKLKEKLKGDAIGQTWDQMKVSIFQRSEFIRSKINKKVMIGIGASVIGIAVISTAVVANLGTDVYALSINGKKVGYVSDEESVFNTVDQIQKNLNKENKGIKILYNKDSVKCVPTDLNEDEVTLLNEKKLEKKILQSDIMKAKAWAVRVDNKDLVATTTKNDAETVLDEIKRHYQTQGSQLVEATFKQPVIVTQAAVKLGAVMNKEEAVTFLLTGTKEMQPYTAQDGDTAWDIAIKNNMSIDDLLAANPNFDLSKLKIGTQLNLTVAKPYMTVVSKEIVSTTEDIDFQTTYQNSNTLYAGQVKVKSEGVKGKKETRIELVKENGKLIANNIIDSKVVEAPKNAVALKGTKAIVGYVGKSSGVFGSPMSHLQVSSGFGSRGGGRHLGVDLRNPCGTPIYAAESGKVTFAGYSGSYGNLVKISHGGGLESYYGHCNSLLVSAGQTVKKGQQIGTVGATGNATGYHLHFEVRLNGVAQNPFNYI